MPVAGCEDDPPPLKLKEPGCANPEGLPGVEFDWPNGLVLPVELLEAKKAGAAPEALPVDVLELNEKDPVVTGRGAWLASGWLPKANVGVAPVAVDGGCCCC